MTFISLPLLLLLVSSSSYLYICSAFRSPSFVLRRSIHSCTNVLSSCRLFLKVALTREAGSNDKLKEILVGRNIDCVEVPCIAFGPGKDLDRLASAMTSADIIALSSPQAAAVFLTSWKGGGKPNVKIATVGKGTSKQLLAEGITPFFEPSDSTAETFALELPQTHGMKVLYPTSAIAENIMQNGLEKRGFTVTRLNTYETVEATWDAESLAGSLKMHIVPANTPVCNPTYLFSISSVVAKDCEIVTFASPSAVKTWASRCGHNYVAVTIGPTSAKAASGFKEVISPKGSKGLEAWADLIISAVDEYDFGVC